MTPPRLSATLLLALLLAAAQGAEAPKAPANSAPPATPAPKTEAAAVPRIEAAEAAKLVAEGKAVLVDCREPSEWADTGVAGPASLLAKSDFDAAQLSWQPFLAANKDKQIILYCRSGNRAGIIAATLREKGYQVANAGAFTAWQAAGLPTRKVEAQPAPAAPAK
jgi:phage shock protein E